MAQNKYKDFPEISKHVLEFLSKVLATMFVSVSDGLPKTSYIKMIDIWLITSLFFPFFEVITVGDDKSPCVNLLNIKGLTAYRY